MFPQTKKKYLISNSDSGNWIFPNKDQNTHFTLSEQDQNDVLISKNEKVKKEKILTGSEKPVYLEVKPHLHQLIPVPPVRFHRSELSLSLLTELMMTRVLYAGSYSNQLKFSFYCNKHIWTGMSMVNRSLTNAII